MANNFGDYLGQGLMAFGRNLTEGINNAQKLALEQKQIDQMAALRQAQLEQMQYERQRQEKADWQKDYERGMGQHADRYLTSMLTGQPAGELDPSVMGYVDPAKLATVQKLIDDRKWTQAFTGNGTPPASYATPQPKPTSDAFPAAPAGAPDFASAPTGDGPIWKRNNNPGNLRVPGQNAYQTFPDMDSGLAAMSKQLDRYAGRGLNTIRSIVSTYAPSNENNTAAYIGMVSKSMGVAPDQPLDLSDPKVKAALMRPMLNVEGSGKAIPDESLFKVVGLSGTQPTAADNQIMDIATSGPQPAPGVQLAQAGGKTMTDATGTPPAQPQPQGMAVFKLPPDQFARFVMGAPKERQGELMAAYKMVNPQDKWDLKEGADGFYRVDKNTGAVEKVEGLPSKNGGAFGGTGMDQQSWSAVNDIAPKIQAGTATDDEKRKYMIAEAHLSTPKVTTDPGTGAQTVMQLDLTQFGFPSLRGQARQPTVEQTPTPAASAPQAGQPKQEQPQTGYTTTQTGNRKPMAAGDAGKIQGANLSAAYLEEVEKKLFPNGQYDRMAMFKSYLPGAEESDIRNKIRESIGYALYLKTGAAATPKEIAEQESLYMPGMTDNADVAKSKLQRLKSFLSSVVQGAGRESPKGETGEWSQPDQSVDLKSKYGLE